MPKRTRKKTTLGFAEPKEPHILVQWLQIFRFHTVPATLLLVVGFWLVGGGNLFSFEAIAIFIYAILLHSIGFGHNSLMDVAKGYDQQDPHKQHFPLVKGTIDLNTAHIIIQTLMILTALYSIAIALFLANNAILFIIFIFLHTVFGHAYNDSLDKATAFKWIPIGLCYAFLGLGAFFISAVDFNIFVILGAVYVFMQIVFQIGWEGELKDIEATAEASMLRRLKCKLENDIFRCPLKAKIFGYASKIINILVGLIVVLMLDDVIVYLVFSFVMMELLVELVNDRFYIRHKELVKMSVMEVLTVYAIIVAFSPIIGYLEATALMIFGILWFVIFNKILWGTRVGPRV